IVMAWNLAFDNLLNWIVNDPTRLAAFNTAITKRYPKRTGIVIKNQDHFEDFKEFEVIEICQTASLISKNVIEILREKLKKRNAAAHPSQVVFVHPRPTTLSRTSLTTSSYPSSNRCGTGMILLRSPFQTAPRTSDANSWPTDQCLSVRQNAQKRA